MVQVSWGCTCPDGARRSICCNCHISSQYNSLYLSMHVFVLGIMTMFMFPLCKCTFDVWFSGLSLKKIFSTAIAFTEGILKNNAEHKTSWESPWRGKTRSVFSKKHLFPQTLQGNALSPKCSDLLWLSNSFSDLNLTAQRTQWCIFSWRGSMMLVLLITAGWQVLHCEPHTTHGAGWGLLIMT